MKKLLRCLSARVADSSEYSVLRSKTPSAYRIYKSKPKPFSVPEGHLPVYVGEEKKRFIVSAELLNEPIFLELLNESAQEYGYEQEGVLRIPCHIIFFERLLESLRMGGEYSANQDLLNFNTTSDR